MLYLTADISDMQQVTSAVSGKPLSRSNAVMGHLIRPNILAEIQKEYPKFSGDSYISLQELNHFRSRCMANLMRQESGVLNEMENKVMAMLGSDLSLTASLREEEKEDPLTLGQLMADKIARFGGSWLFIISFFFFLMLWIITNAWILIQKPFDPYPFILLNLILSCLAAIQAPLIMMSQNRQEEKDRQRSKKDYMINLKAELELRLLHEKMDHLLVHQQATLLEIQQIQMDMLNDILGKIAEK